MILMLEDDPERIERFRIATRRIDPSLSLHVWRDAYQMSRELESHLAAARLISLDHDLEALPGDASDLGDGLLVVKALSQRAQQCPVIIHSSNGTRSDWMAGEFELAGWTYRRVAPIGERWIEEYWRCVTSELLGFPPAYSSRRVIDRTRYQSPDGTIA